MNEPMISIPVDTFKLLVAGAWKLCDLDGKGEPVDIDWTRRMKLHFALTTAEAAYEAAGYDVATAYATED